MGLKLGLQASWQMDGDLMYQVTKRNWTWLKAYQWTVLLKHNEFTICSNEVLNGLSTLIGVANKIHYCCLDMFNVCSIYTYMYMVSAILRVIQISIPSDDLQKVF